MSADVYVVYNVFCADCGDGYGPFDYEDDAANSAAVHNDEHHNGGKP